MYLVCQTLNLDRKKIISNLTKTIGAIISMDMTGTDTNALADKIADAERKRTNLIELYTGGDIDRAEFTALRAKYDAEIESLKSMAESIEKQQAMVKKQQEVMKDIRNTLEELIKGIEYEDEFYTQILDKMVINDRDNIDVYLNLLPLKWSYTVAKASKKALAPKRNILGASLPMSVSMADSSGYGMA